MMATRHNVSVSDHRAVLELGEIAVSVVVDATYTYVQEYRDTSGFDGQRSTPGIKNLVDIRGQFSIDDPEHASAITNMPLPIGATLLMGTPSLPKELSISIESCIGPGRCAFTFQRGLS